MRSTTSVEASASEEIRWRTVVIGGKIGVGGGLG